MSLLYGGAFLEEEEEVERRRKEDNSWMTAPQKISPQNSNLKTIYLLPFLGEHVYREKGENTPIYTLSKKKSTNRHTIQEIHQQTNCPKITPKTYSVSKKYINTQQTLQLATVLLIYEWPYWTD